MTHYNQYIFFWYESAKIMEQFEISEFHTNLMPEINQKKVSRGVHKLLFGDVKRNNGKTCSLGVSPLFALRQLCVDLMVFQTIK